MNIRFKLATGAALTGLMLLSSPNAFPATKQANLISTFQKYLSDGKYAFEAAKLEAENKYLPQISKSEQTIQSLKSQILNSSEVKIVKFSLTSNYRGYLSCPVLRLDCIGIDKAAQFQVGEITSIKPEVFANAGLLEVMPTILSYLNELDSIFKSGEIQLSNKSNYDQAVQSFRVEYQNLSSLSNQYSDAISRAKSSLLEIDSRDFAIRAALKAAKRASNSPQIYDKAFVAAFKFEYNRYSLDKYASQPWSTINSFKALDSAIKVTKLSEKADLIDMNYNFASADQFNKSIGNIFTGEADYRSDFGFISKLYKSATNVKLSS
jgi:hypothetical protein